MNSTKKALEELHTEPINILGEVGGNAMDEPENLNLEAEADAAIVPVSRWQRFEKPRDLLR